MNPDAPSHPARRPWQNFGLTGLLVLAAGFVYGPVLRGTWLWDDAAEVVRNPLLRDAAGLRAIWTGAQSEDYFPLKSTFQWIEWHLWGGAPAGYHLANLGCHVLSALLLWRVLSRLGVRCGWLGGLLWIVHPVAVESVAWIAEFKNTVSLPFLLGSFLAYLDAEHPPARGATRRSLLWFLAALLCKTSVVMFPVVLLLREALKPAEARPRWAATLPFFVLSAGAGGVTVWFQDHRVIAGLIMPVTTGGERVVAALRAAAFYAEKGVLPFSLLPIYPAWAGLRPTLEQALGWAGILALLLWAWRRRRHGGGPVLFGAGVFLLNLVPVLGLAPLAYLRIAPVADHLAYLSLLGLVGLGAAGAESGWRAAAPPWRPALAAAGALLLACLALQSRRYAAEFSSDERLWNYTLARNPQAWVAHNNLALDLIASGRLDEAIREDRAAEQLEPDFAEIHSNLGLALFETGRVPESIAESREALRLQPSLAGAHLNLGRALLAAGAWDEAERELAAALRLHGPAAEIENNSGMVLAHRARWPEAIAAFTRAFTLDPSNAEAHNNLGFALAQNGREEEAISEYEEALRLRPQSAQFEGNLANALARSGRLAEAVGHYQAALRLRPNDAGTHRNFAFALHALGREEQARQQYGESVRLGADAAR
jgi:tetratricopeptide (TPR) repeat protein